MSLTQTPHLKTREITRRWYLVDAQGVSLGRLAALAGHLLMGKGKTTYSPHMDQGDCVVVINAQKVQLTGNKPIQKMDFRASGYRGGQTFTHYGKLLEEKPERAVELAVSGMLPKNKHRSRCMKRLKVFRGVEGREKYAGAVVVDTKDRKIKGGGPFVLPPSSGSAPQSSPEVAS